MFLRALIAFLALPGSFAGIVPALIVRSDHRRFPAAPAAWVLVAVGLILLFWCVRDFWLIGRGTLAPWDPPKRLVVVGLYRYTRNPMYVAITILLTGWILVTGSKALAIYAIVLCIGFHLRVILYEEPRLRRQFPEDWAEYSARVNRWLPFP